MNGSTTVNHLAGFMGSKINSIIIKKDIEFSKEICFIIITVVIFLHIFDVVLVAELLT